MRLIASGLQVDVVETGAAQSYQACIAGGERLEYFGICLVIDKNTDHVVTGGQADRFTVEGLIEIAQLMAGAGIGGIQELAVVALGAENGNFHLVISDTGGLRMVPLEPSRKRVSPPTTRPQSARTES